MKKTIFILTLLLPFGLLIAQDNDSDIDQWGNGNGVAVTQTGAENWSNVFTVGNNNQPSFVDQVGVGESNSNAVQFGNGNSVDVSQLNHFTKDHDLANSQIYQNGLTNSATVDQWVVNHPTQFILGGEVIADVEQDGNGNDATVDQEGLWINANIFQDGNNGVANQYQGTSDYYDGRAFLSDADIDQGSNVNGESVAEQHQVGLQNDAYINQDSWNGSHAEQLQINAKGAITGHRFIDVNQAEIYQSDGGNNQAYQAQFFNNQGVDPNVASVIQEGIGNYSLEVQVGGDNLSSVHQFGNNNDSDVYQKAHNVADPTLNTANPFGLQYY
jgi:hypothetical protein